MIEKTSYFSGDTAAGPAVIPLFNTATDPFFEKVASTQLLPDVVRYIESLRPSNDAVYNLVNALGAGEFFSSNVNGDFFPEAALIHRPDDWTGNPLIDRARWADWPYGFPTFYSAKPYCFPAGTLVVMADRSRKPIEDVREGDVVATMVGPRPVRALLRRDYDGVGVSLTLRGEPEPLVATEEHPVLVYRRDQVHCRHKYCRLTEQQGRRAHRRECVEFREPIGEPAWVPISAVLPGDYLVLHPPTHGTETVSPDFAELVGWVAAEGHLSADGYAIQFSFSENNLADIRAVTACLERNGAHVTVTPRPQYRLVMLTVSKKDLHAQLSKYVRGVKSEKELLSPIFAWSRDSLLRMLGAYISGDGHVPRSGKNRGQLRIRSSSPQMLRVLADVVRALGVEATVQSDRAPGLMRSPTNGKTYPDNGSGCVAVSANWCAPLLQYTRKCFEFTVGKRCRKERLRGQVLVQVLEREDVELKEGVFCLSVPGPEHFFAGEVVVHNCHHRNKDPTRAFGEVELACWNDRMKRVELVTRVDRDKCYQFNGVPVWDKLVAGMYPDVSMGARVPFDTCSICLDWKLYREAQSTFDPRRHKHPGEAVLHFHRNVRPIRGLAVTRKFYCDHARDMMNRILPDGRKVFVYNDYPRFFDISFVFIGADKTAKTMMKIAGEGKRAWSFPPQEKVASPRTPLTARIDLVNARRRGDREEMRKLEETSEKTAQPIRKSAGVKEGEIVKDVVPSQFAGKAVGALTAAEKDLPKELLHTMGRMPLETALSTSSALGVVLRPREFQRVVLVQLGQPEMADELDACGAVFPQCACCADEDSVRLDVRKVLPSLARLLLQHFYDRSALAPSIERRFVVLGGARPVEGVVRSSHPTTLMRKIGAAYKSYRDQLMDMAAHAQAVLGDIAPATGAEFHKFAAAQPEEVFSPLSVMYLKTAFLNELGAELKTARAGVERGFPLRNT